MSCWHGHGGGRGCWPGYEGASPRGWYVPVDDCGWYGDRDWPMRSRSRERDEQRWSREASLEARLEELREELRRVESALADLSRSSGMGTAG
jgi:hypothetical protein